MAELPSPPVTQVASLSRLRRVVAGRGQVVVAAIWIRELLLLDVAVAANSLWLLRVVAVLLLAVLPGQLLLRALRVPAASVARYVAYLPCASIAILIATGLVVDLVGPLLGVHEPLRRWPLLIGLNLVIVALAHLGRRAAPSCELKISGLIGHVHWFWPLLLPLTSVVAAGRLDNGDGNVLAFVVLIGVAVIIPVCTVLGNRLHRSQTSLILYGSGLALMLLTSMRSSYVIGFDINSEYFDFHQTVVNGFWHLGHLSAYEAMLSLTVFPASLHAFVSGQDVWVFKLGYPALFAFFPVAVFELGTRFLSRRAAVVASAIVIVQAYFFQQQPEIARQELALLIFAGIMGALLDSSLGKWPQLGLVSALGMTLVVCHYSTTYITIFLCLSACLLAVTLARRTNARPPVLPWLIAALVMSVSALIWYVPATYSGSNVSDVAQSLRQSGIQLLPGRLKGENVISAYFSGPREPPISPRQYETSVANYYSEHLRFLVPLAVAKNPAYNLQAGTAPDLPDHAPLVASGLADAEFLVQQLINALAVICSLIFALRRKGSALTCIIGCVGIASLFVLAASRLSGTLAADYNSSRLFLQCLFILALLEAALFELVLTRLKARSWLELAVFGSFSLLLLVAFVGNSDLAAPLTGGNPPLILYSKGEDYSAFYPNAQEQTTAQWLATAVPTQRVIYADYFAQLRLDQFTNLRTAVFNDVTPRTIDWHAWVFASTANTVEHRMWEETNSGLLDLVFPSRFLDQYFNIVCSTGSTEVFHR